MKNLNVILFIFFVYSIGFSQKTDKKQLKVNIYAFYDSFIKKDTAIAANLIFNGLKLIELNGEKHIISNSYYGWEKIKNSILNEKDLHWRKNVSRIKVKIDSNSANVWVKYPHKLFLKDSFKKDVNFLFIKKTNDWKIAFITYFVK